MLKTAISIALALVIAAPLSAQTKKGGGSGATPVDATVSQIHDRRTTTSFAQLSISLELAGTKMSDVSAARVTVLKAVDDTGRDLTPDPEAPTHMIAAAGWAPKVGRIHTPIHFFFVPDTESNHRMGATIGMNW